MAKNESYYHSCLSEKAGLNYFQWYARYQGKYLTVILTAVASIFKIISGNDEKEQ